jgi:serine/threonine-protein kinase
MSIQQFAGYSIVRDITGGGMANLYVALDPHKDRVVLRVLRPEYARKRRMRKKFESGVAILRELKHPHIVRVLQTGMEDKQPYMVMEFVPGRHLRELILHRDALVEQHRLGLIRQMADMLGYLHTAGYLHLDFKPENLIVRDDAFVVLIDFDLAMVRKPKPVKIRNIPGTRAYLPPEVLKQHRVDERADIYSFGVTAYEILCHHKPFEAATVDGMLNAQLDPAVRPTPLSQYTREVPKALESIVLKCLAKDPDSRYPSMSLVRKDLEALL